MILKEAHPYILTSTLPFHRRKDARVVVTVRLDVFRLSSASCRLVVPIGRRVRVSWERHGWRRSFETGWVHFVADDLGEITEDAICPGKSSNKERELSITSPSDTRASAERTRQEARGLRLAFALPDSRQARFLPLRPTLLPVYQRRQLSPSSLQHRQTSLPHLRRRFSGQRPVRREARRAVIENLTLDVSSRTGALVLERLVRFVEDGEERAVLYAGHQDHGGVRPT
jgi:hypothetical protein